MMLGGDVCECASHSPERSSGPPPASQPAVSSRWRRTWGIDPIEAVKPLPGDDTRAGLHGHRDPWHHHRRTARRGLAVAGPDGIRARRLVQLRPARHGRYERRRVERGLGERSRRRHHADPARRAGFEVKVVEPGHALVLYSRHRARRAPGGRDRPRRARSESDAGGLAASGAFLGTTPQRLRSELGVRPRADRGRPDAADRAVPGLGSASRWPAVRASSGRSWASASSS